MLGVGAERLVPQPLGGVVSARLSTGSPSRDCRSSPCARKPGGPTSGSLSVWWGEQQGQGTPRPRKWH